ncbi:MAG TPA: HAD-IA family hydrolase, partial [candidate division Zixibacteria bacterium]|nr:HAD-IA family hydrolase [candidate division Zixibacteria bacterium]
DLLEHCQAIAGGDEVDEGKPAPDVYLLAAKRLDMDPARCLALEDSVPGINAAATAGMLTVAVPNGDTASGNFEKVAFVYKSLVEVASDLENILERGRLE